MGTDIVYPWIAGNAFANDDLKYSLRSVETNWVGRFRITIVGDRHPGLKDVWHVPHERLNEPHLPKALDSVRKMETILATPYIQDGFVYMYDDVYLLQPMDAMYIRQRFATAEIAPDWHLTGTGRKHQAQLFATVKALREKGFKRIWNYETHTPRWYEKRKMQEVIDIYRPAGNRLLLATLYFNHHYRHLEPTILHPMDTVKVAFSTNRFGDHSVPMPATNDPILQMQAFEKLIVGKHYLNHNNGGIGQVGLQYLRHSLWPEPSEMEIPTRIQPTTNLRLA